MLNRCELACFACESHIYPDQGHGFFGEKLADADARTLAFFAKH
jgi:hypothetical protein